ncbi:ZFWD3 [Symbiodinium natans]|uniref:ZFWD3 protein n=1 Tax=Symbiodinium natans TaxID=878477 RepID=A0A812LVN5_9DINO|nr:ZFWD3 [Symbiodinium natans]
MLGKGSELRKLYYMPHNMGHSDGVNCMLMADGKIYTGGRDEYLFVWRAERTANGEFELMQDCPPIHLGASITAIFYEASAKWLLCGLWNGDIRAFCKEPMREERLAGHRRSVTCLQVHSSVLISGSNEGQVRLWTFNGQTFQGHGQPLTNPSGPVTCLRVLGEALWVGGYEGISCFDLGTLQARGTISSQHHVTGLLECQGFMIATFRNGEVSIYEASGSQVFRRHAMGEHASNTAVELMLHPATQKPLLLCGQVQGYVTAYDLPEFRPRGSFCCKDRSDVKARWGGGVGKRLTQVTLPLRPPQNPLFLCPACHACFSSRASFFSRIEVVLRGFPQPSLPPTLVTLTLPSPPLARRPASYESASYRLLG